MVGSALVEGIGDIVGIPVGSAVNVGLGDEVGAGLTVG